MTPDGWLKTGDVARRDSKGFFHIVDRKKEVIKYKGYQGDSSHHIILQDIPQHSTRSATRRIGEHSCKTSRSRGLLCGWCGCRWFGASKVCRFSLNCRLCELRRLTLEGTSLSRNRQKMLPSKRELRSKFKNGSKERLDTQSISAGVF